MSCGEAKEGIKDVVSLPMSIEGVSVASRFVANLKPVPEIAAPGHVDEPFS